MQPEKRIKESLPEPGDRMGRAMPGENGGAMSNKMPKERLTEDLLARLLNSKSPEDYLSQGETIDRELPDYLFALLDANGMNRSQVARISSICLFRVKRDNENWPKITRVIRWLTVIESWFHSLTRSIAHFSDCWTSHLF